MADSDDEYERRNVRDKFRHERSDYERRDDKRGRDNWEDRWIMRLVFKYRKWKFARLVSVVK